MEDPQPLARAHVEPADVALVIAHALGRHAFAERRADDHRILGDHRRRLQTDLAGGEVGEEGLIVVELQIHGAVLAERFDGRAGLRIERDQAVSRRDIEDALFLAVGPIGHAAA